MNSVIVCESWFGNTHRIAEAVTAELAEIGEATLLAVEDDIPPLDDVDLLVVGAPTHVHGMSSTMSRKAALDQSEQEGGEPGRGARGWLEELPSVESGRAAAFDTRAHKPELLVGSAAKGIAKRLRRHGFTLVAPPESFFVVGSDGPLEDGEVERAHEWARELARVVEAGRAVAKGVA
jgi:hypothetical protein